MENIRFKIELEAYTAPKGRYRHVNRITTHITSVVWNDKRGVAPYTVAKLGHAQVDMAGKPVAPPQLFSKLAAEAIVEQLPKWRFLGPGPDGLAIAKIVPVTVQKSA
jgi:hypothetical protein